MLNNIFNFVNNFVNIDNLKYINYSFGKSDIDWCEPNYLHSEYIAEYYNTLSNLSFIIIGLLSLSYNLYYSKPIELQFIIIIYIIIGLCSFLFHSTLSFLGQITDELGILIILIYCYSYYNYYSLIRTTLLILFCIPTLLYIPEYNPCILFIIGGTIIIRFYMLISNIMNELNKKDYILPININYNNNKNVYNRLCKIFNYNLLLFIISFGCWLFDKYCYDPNLHIHYVWHILISINGIIMIYIIDYLRKSNKPKII
jgi:alkaline ceramidase